MTKPQLNIPLKPCPFKQEGDQHEVQVLPQGSGYPETWQVVCSCGASGPSDLGESGACEQWNTRPVEDALLEACEAMMDGLDDYWVTLPEGISIVNKARAAIAWVVL